MVTFRALGPFEAVSGGETLDLGGQRQQAVLARLIVAAGRAVPVSVLIDELWPGEPPAQALSTIQGYVSRLRRALEPDRAPREEAGVLVSAPPGYALRAAVEDVDCWHFEHLVKSDHEGPAATLQRMEAALALWRGPALAGFQELIWAQTEATRLDELRLLAVERRADAALRLGRTGPMIPDLEAHASAHPLREEAWRLLALALYRAGRQGDALGALRRARVALRDELGLDLGPALQRLEQDILVQAAHLDAPGPAADAPPDGPSAPSVPVGASGAASGPAALRVLIADDQALVRTGLKVILDSEPGLDLVGEAENGEQAIALVRSVRPDVVLMDIQMPRLDGLAAARRILAAEAPPKVIMMTTFGTDENLYAALRAGVSGFVLKTSPPEQLIAAVRAAVAGDALLDPAVTTHLIAAFAGRRDPAAPEGLSDSDIDLIKLVARGFTNRQIAMTLAVPEQEVADEVTTLLRGLGLVDRAQLVVLAYERGLVSPGSRDA
ncbi:response regulator [Microbispora sp. SCL1-1]|jgi:DNA-binding NarL/FixJ family response regulator/DNA-binding SARP family transcriptional activator|uniref:BTAD domain-containing putative transcriptional regulator n=1 Tax=Microbispora TaxID=2005 RepID=UPI001158322D|nr:MULTISPECIES: BTAD domain-containing putative transcriptional regulator [Microbispora]NJP22683.1 response regulator [Microbispora sp. CL1-1]TQS16730.1 response regulator [Microbispora sp. SCL1-1]